MKTLVSCSLYVISYVRHSLFIQVLSTFWTIYFVNMLFKYMEESKDDASYCNSSNVCCFLLLKSKWIWPGNIAITHCRPTHCCEEESQNTNSQKTSERQLEYSNQLSLSQKGDDCQGCENTKYCKFGNFRENLFSQIALKEIFATQKFATMTWFTFISKWQWFRHFTRILFSRNFRENKTLAKISEFTVYVLHNKTRTKHKTPQTMGATINKESTIKACFVR